MATPRYLMTISRLTIDKLGVKLYDRVSTVMAELVANAYDADATAVTIEAPMGEFLASKRGGKITDKGLCIEIVDNGHGIDPGDINAFYLKVGAERRTDERRGDTSPGFGRKVMGRKGIGKLAPFGICKQIEVITSGGAEVKGKNEVGKAITGYRTAHFVMNGEMIISDTDKDYEPEVGPLDGVVRPDHGTTIRLSQFHYRRVPVIDDFASQIASRFGLPSENWGITLADNTKTETDPDRMRLIEALDIETMENTKIEFKLVETEKVPSADPSHYRVLDPSGAPMSDLTAGFTNDEGRFHPVTGWVAYSKNPIKDDTMAGVRIHCRGKIAAQTAVFNKGAGFHGEHQVRSYLVGELHADWLDEYEDLIETNRRDILWSDDLGHCFEVWGQNVVAVVGTLSRNPLKQSIWERFRKVARIEERINDEFPSDEHGEIRDRAWELVELMAKRLREDELEDSESVENVVQLSFVFAPHVTLDRKLREAAEDTATPLAFVASLLKTARIAELYSFGKIAEGRVKVIQRVAGLLEDENTTEHDLQKTIESAPWLIDPQWSEITANETLNTFKRKFEKYYKKRTGQDIYLGDFGEAGVKRPDFILSSQAGKLEIVEIKSPGHRLGNDEMERIDTYVRTMLEFLDEPGNVAFRDEFPKSVRVTLVCDKLNLSGMAKTVFEGLTNGETLEHINWNSFFTRVIKAHDDFLAVARKLKKHATK